MSLIVVISKLNEWSVLLNSNNSPSGSTISTSIKNNSDKGTVSNTLSLEIYVLNKILPGEESSNNLANTLLIFLSDTLIEAN